MAIYAMLTAMKNLLDGSTTRTIFVKRIIFSVIGVSLTGVCIALQQKAALGTDPFTCFVTGFADVFGSSYGNVYPIITAILLVGVFVVKKHYIGLATLVNLVLIGITADFSLGVLDQLYTVVTVLDKVLTFAIALISLCFASAMYITADLGVSSYDAVSLIMSDKTPLQYRWCRIATDLVCVLVGFFLGAAIGVGTLFVAFCMGPLTQFFKIHITDVVVYGRLKQQKFKE